MPPLTLRHVREYPVPPGGVALWWLGQQSFLIKSPGGKVVALDPYLSNSCAALVRPLGYDMERLYPPPMGPAGLAGIDLYVVTHTHQDHLDPETLGPYRAAGGRGPFLGPAESVEKFHALGVPHDETVLTWPNKTHAVGDLTLRATFAIPPAGDDLTHVGYLVFVGGGPTLYFTGDTAYEDVLHLSVGPHRPDVMIAVINGGFRNLGPYEAAKLAKALDPELVIPCHYDLFRDNGGPPRMLRTNLLNMGIGEKYGELSCGVPWVYRRGESGSPRAATQGD